jgi:hypothetical protein
MTGSMWKRALPVLVSGGVLAWLFSGMDLAALAVALSWRIGGIITLALLAYGAITLWLEACSITRLSGLAHQELSGWMAARLKCASYLLGIVNYALGAGALAVLLRRHTRLSLGHAASLILLISSTDLIVVLGTVCAGVGLVEARAPTLRVGLIAAAIFVFLLGLTLLRMPQSLGPLDRIRSLAIFHGLRTVPLAKLGELLALRICFTASFVALFAAGFYAFQIEPPWIERIVGVLVVGGVAGLPIAIAGLGTSQAAFLFIFAKYAPQEQLLAQSLVLSAGMLALRGLMGLGFAREYTREALQETHGAAR